MHELSVAQGILDIIEAERRKHGFGEVLAVHLRLGALSGIDEQALDAAFEAVREGTCAARAVLKIQADERVLECRSCGARLAADSRPTRCPECDSLDLALRGAMNLDVVSLEVE